MDPTTAILTLTASATALALGSWRFGPRLRWAWRVRQFRDVGSDPGAPSAREAASRWAQRDDAAGSLSSEAAWAVALSESTDDEAWQALATFRTLADPAGEVAVGLSLGHRDGRPWRAWIRALPDPSDAPDLRAERFVALGELDAARRCLEALPADHWRGCRVRAVLYALDGDLERAKSARHAAWALAPDAARAPLARQRDPHRLGVR